MKLSKLDKQQNVFFIVCKLSSSLCNLVWRACMCWRARGANQTGSVLMCKLSAVFCLNRLLKSIPTLDCNLPRFIFVILSPLPSTSDEKVKQFLLDISRGSAEIQSLEPGPNLRHLEARLLVSWVSI